MCISHRISSQSTGLCTIFQPILWDIFSQKKFLPICCPTCWLTMTLMCQRNSIFRITFHQVVLLFLMKFRNIFFHFYFYYCDGRLTHLLITISLFILNYSSLSYRWKSGCNFEFWIHSREFAGCHYR